jgi:hypothetical protein
MGAKENLCLSKRYRTSLWRNEGCLWMGCIFLVALVVAHHSVMAYLPEAPPVARSLPHWWQAFPIVDSAKWSGFSLFVAFNDTFFMAAFFLLSGLFVWSSLHRKGVNAFLRDRSLRLGKAFLFAAFVISPLAYYATYKQISITNPSVGFWKEWSHLGSWPAGPAWFLWVLLAFDLIAAGLFRFAPQSTRTVVLLTNRFRPATLFLLLTAFSAACFTPMALHFGSMSWSTYGPFSVQTSRIFHYFAYFMAGLLLGAAGLKTSILQSGSLLARRWWLWIAGCLLSFVLMDRLGARRHASATLHPLGSHRVLCFLRVVCLLHVRCARSLPQICERQRPRLGDPW